MIFYDIGDKVFFVPSHDGEYNARPNIGEVVGDGAGDSYTIRSIDNGPSKGNTYFVPARFMAHIDQTSEILALIKYLLQRELDLITLLYMIELDVDHKESYDRIRHRAQSRDRYHIN
jgi:hypothetical protein